MTCGGSCLTVGAAEFGTRLKWEPPALFIIREIFHFAVTKSWEEFGPASVLFTSTRTDG